MQTPVTINNASSLKGGLVSVNGSVADAQGKAIPGSTFTIIAPKAALDVASIDPDKQYDFVLVERKS